MNLLYTLSHVTTGNDAYPASQVVQLDASQTSQLVKAEHLAVI